MELNLIGDLMIDEYKFHSISRISPEAPVPVLLFKKYHKALGGSGNLAACLSILGYKINLFGVCSSDSFAGVASLCDKHDLSPQLIFNNKNLLTTKKLRILGDENQICRIDTDSALDKKNLEAFTEHVHKNINHNAVTALSDYAKGVSDIFIDVNKISPPKYIDPKYPDWKRYKGCSPSRSGWSCRWGSYRCGCWCYGAKSPNRWCGKRKWFSSSTQRGANSWNSVRW